MKTITPISIWDNGTVQEASVLNTYAINVTLNSSATFYWVLFSTVDGNIANQLSQGNLSMSGEAYEQWELDEYAWEYVATQLNLVITGDYSPPTTSTTTTLEPITTTTTSTTTENVVIE
jgi:hypothetical protein